MKYPAYDYRVYGRTHCYSYDYIRSAEELDKAKEIASNLDTNTYIEYLIVRHHIEYDMDEVVDRGCLDMPKVLTKSSRKSRK